MHAALGIRCGTSLWNPVRAKTSNLALLFHSSSYRSSPSSVKLLSLRSGVRPLFRMENFWTGGSVDKNKAMVESLQQYGIIKSKKVAEVMEKIDRGLFVQSDTTAYVDSPMQIGYNATISAPHMHAACLELLEQHLQPGMRALDVGSGTGYLTACFALMVGPQGRAVGVEHIPELASFSIENIKKSAASSFLEGSLSVHITVKTGPSITDAAMTRLAQGTKFLAEGGIAKVFQQNFGIYTGEQLRKAFACYLSTSTGPVIGTLYLSSLRLAFCSDNPLCRYTPSGQQEWIYYKVVAQLDQLKGVNPSSNNKNPAEKYIQIVTSDNHDFWFMGFVSYDKALKNLIEALQRANMKQNHQT